MKKLKILNQNGDLTGFGIVFVAIMALVLSLLFDVGANAIHAVTATSVESGVYGYGLSAYYERARIEEAERIGQMNNVTAETNTNKTTRLLLEKYDTFIPSSTKGVDFNVNYIKAAATTPKGYN